MFYCQKCKEKNEWPESFSGSYGRCEVCRKTADCYDVPSYALPARPRKKS